MKSFAAHVGALASVVAQDALHTCSSGKSACPTNVSCCEHQYYNAEGCDFGAPHVACCAPGPALEQSTTLKNCLIIGDSVSNGYTPKVAEIMNRTCLVQHAPWAAGGSANDVQNGLYNLQECRWLRTAMRPDKEVYWDVIQFNFGLHDLDKNDTNGLQFYESKLKQVTEILLTSSVGRVQYALTTPYMPKYLAGDHVVEYLNERAISVMRDHAVPMIDLHLLVLQHCGSSYKTCDICDNETMHNPDPSVECGYHYNSQGYDLLAEAVADSFAKLLQIETVV